MTVKMSKHEFDCEEIFLDMSRKVMSIREMNSYISLEKSLLLQIM